MASTQQTGLQLRRHRINRGMSPEDLGEQVGVSGMTIRRLERGIGQPTARTKYRIARELGLDVTDIWPVRQRDLVA